MKKIKIMSTSKKKNILSFFPTEEELEKSCKKMSAPNYPRVNMGLSEHPTPLEISKHGLCKKILAYKQDNNLTTGELAKQINLTVPEVEDILFARIDKFTLDRLVIYANNLFPFHLAVHEEPIKIKRNGSSSRSHSKTAIHLKKCP